MIEKYPPGLMRVLAVMGVAMATCHGQQKTNQDLYWLQDSGQTPDQQRDSGQTPDQQKDSGQTPDQQKDSGQTPDHPRSYQLSTCRKTCCQVQCRQNENLHKRFSQLQDRQQHRYQICVQSSSQISQQKQDISREQFDQCYQGCSTDDLSLTLRTVQLISGLVSLLHDEIQDQETGIQNQRQDSYVQTAAQTTPTRTQVKEQIQSGMSQVCQYCAFLALVLLQATSGLQRSAQKRSKGTNSPSTSQMSWLPIPDQGQNRTQTLYIPSQQTSTTESVTDVCSPRLPCASWTCLPQVIQVC